LKLTPKSKIRFRAPGPGIFPEDSGPQGPGILPLEGRF